ncbi:MAG TPA: hypothetical protein VFR02_04380 [bacterium]|nr:hypothetical protein [bacterium]
MTKKMLVLILGCLLPAAGAWAKDDALARAASVPLGERAAFYLQSYLDGLNILEGAKGKA